MNLTGYPLAANLIRAWIRWKGEMTSEVIADAMREVIE